MNEIEKDHPDQAVDTDIPDEEFVDMDAWNAMRLETVLSGLSEVSNDV